MKKILKNMGNTDYNSWKNWGEECHYWGRCNEADMKIHLQKFPNTCLVCKKLKIQEKEKRRK